MRLDRDIEDLEVQETTRRLDLDDITDLAAHKALGDGGVDGDLLLLEVRLGVRDQCIGQLSTRLGIADGDLAQDLDAIGRDLRLVDDTSVSDLCLELSDLPFEEALSFLGSVVLGIFREVTLIARLSDLTRDLGGGERIRVR